VALLNEHQEVDAGGAPIFATPNDTIAGIAFITRNGANLDAEWIASGIYNTGGPTNPVTAAHIHTGNVGQNGGVAGGICSSASGAPGVDDCQGTDGSGKYNKRTNFAWSGGSGDPGVTVMNNGGTYFNMHTQAYGAGQLRGQLLPGQTFARFTGDETPNFYARLEGAPYGTSSKGFAVIYYEAATRFLRAYAVFNSPGVTAVHIHGPASLGWDGGVFNGWALTGNYAGGWVSFSAGPISQMAESHLYNGLFYINVHTTALPNGDCRGQILAWNQAAMTPTGMPAIPAAPSYVALLNDIQNGIAPAASNANMGGLAWFDCTAPTACTGSFLWGGLAAVATQAHIHDYLASTPGFPGSAGVVTDLCGSGGKPACAGGATSVATGLLSQAVGQVDNQAGLTRYVAVHGAAGAVQLRGQIRVMGAPAPQRWSNNNDVANFYVIGTFQAGAVGGGSALCHLSYNQPQASLKYICIHTCANPTQAHFHGPCTTSPCATFSSGVWRDLGTPIASNNYVYMGTLNTITSTEETNLAEGRYYFNVHNAQNTGGCATGIIFRTAALGTSNPNWPTHAAVMDSVQAGFAPAGGDPNFGANRFGLGLIRRTAANTYSTWQHWAGSPGPVDGGHVHSPTTANHNTWHPDSTGVNFAIDTATSSGVQSFYGNTTNTGATGSGDFDLGMHYFALHISATSYAAPASLVRGTVVPTMALPAGTGMTPPPPSSSTGGNPGSSTGAASTVAASFFVAAILAFIAALLQ
jgi:hypothetical protein